MSALLNGLLSIVSRLATFARDGWPGGGGRPAALALADLVYLTIVQIGRVLGVGAGMCMLAVTTAITLKWLFS